MRSVAMKKGDRNVTIPNLLATGTQVTELRAQVNQTRYQLLVALAGLERATACGYQPSFELAPTTDPPEQPVPEGPKKKKDEETEKLNAPNGGNEVKPGKPRETGTDGPATRQGPRL
jgi:hypothetical protein